MRCDSSRLADDVQMMCRCAQLIEFPTPQDASYTFLGCSEISQKELDCQVELSRETLPFPGWAKSAKVHGSRTLTMSTKFGGAWNADSSSRVEKRHRV